MRRTRCRDCGILEGEFHEFGCAGERCPFCSRQLLTCDCLEEHIDTSSCPDDADGYLAPIAREWEAMLTAKGRVPFMYYPNLCAKCGAVSPRFFRVPDREWNRYVEARQRGEVLCRPCFDFIKRTIDGARRTRPQRGRR